MRVRIIFLLRNKGASVPFHHQFLLSQIKENLLMDGERKYADFISYTFSGLKGQTKVSKTGLQFYSSRVTLVLSSPDQGFIDYLLLRMQELKEIRVGSLRLVLESMEKELYPEFSEEIKCICISPVVLVDPLGTDIFSKKFIPPDTDMFSDLLYESTMNRMELSGRFTPEQIASFYKFQIIPDQEYLNRIRSEEKKFARIYPVYTSSGKHEIRGYTFPFTLYAAPEVQRFVFECGLGAFTNKGFGMLDLAAADFTRKTEVYQLSTVNS